MPLKIYHFKIRYRNPAGDFESNYTAKGNDENAGMQRALEWFIKETPSNWVVLEIISMNTNYPWRQTHG